jgi:hypothetical protein
MAGVIKKHAFGFDGEKQVRRAVLRLTKEAASQDCNCVEILRLTAKSFLGVPYVTVVAHVRHIQRGTQFRPARGDYGETTRGAKDFDHAFPESIGNASSRSAARRK